MQLSLLLVIIMAALGFSQMEPMAACTPTSTTTAPPCVLTFFPFMAPQIGPLSTVYRNIMTTHYNIIDCRYCSIVNIDANPFYRGPFTDKISIDILTITRVGCMPLTTAITRRDFRGYPAEETATQAHSVETLVPRARLLRRFIETVAESDLHRRSLQSIAATIAQNIDPDNAELTQKAYELIVQLNSALFAINLINSGFNLTSTCAELRRPEIQLQLTAASLNPKQVGDIVCFASINGFSLNTTNFELLSKLQAAIYAIQVGSDFPTENAELCQKLDIPFGGFIGIDSIGVTDSICRNSSISSTASWTNSSTTTMMQVNMTETVGTDPSAGPTLTGDNGPYSNSSMSTGTAAASDYYGTRMPTTSDSWDVDFPNATYGNVPTHVPPSPPSPLYYAAWTTSTSSAETYKKV